MYSSILVPVSFETDRDSSAAFKAAETLLDAGGKITLLHVVEHLPEYATHYLPEGFRAKQWTEMKEKLEELASDLPGGQAEMVEGHSGRTILDHAKSGGYDCIVIASHRPGMQDLLLGSTS